MKSQKCGGCERLEPRLEAIEGILVNHGLAEFLAGEIYDIEDVPNMIKPANDAVG